MVDANMAIGAAGEAATQAVNLFQGNLMWLGVGILLIVVTVLIILFIKKIIINSIIGIALFLLLQFGLQMELPLIPTLVLSALFGVAGVGAMIVLKFIGLV